MGTKWIFALTPVWLTALVRGVFIAQFFYVRKKHPGPRPSTSNSGAESNFDGICENVSSPRPRWVLLLLVQKVTGARRRNKNTRLIGNANPEPRCSTLMKRLEFRRGGGKKNPHRSSCINHATHQAMARRCVVCFVTTPPPPWHIFGHLIKEKPWLCATVLQTPLCEERPWEEVFF